jgi:flagellar hook-length control protein FliK
MNLTFADINNAFQNLVQPDAPTSGSKGFEGSEARPSLFADNLNKVIKEARAAYESVTTKSAATGNVTGKPENLDEAKNPDLDEMDQLQGLPFLSKLQNLFLAMSGGDLSKITLDAEGLDDLKKLLLKAGFEAGDVDELMSGLKEKAKGKGLGLDEVMKSLAKLSPENEEDTMDEETLMATSALPFITTILNSLGLPKETVDQIISQADRGQQGISLDVVIDQLNIIETQSLFSGQPFQSKEGNSFSMLFEQLGLTLPENTKSSEQLGLALPENTKFSEQLGFTLPENTKSSEQLGLALPENTSSQLGLSDFLASLKILKEKMVSTKKQTDGAAGTTNQTDGRVKESSNTLMDSLFKHLQSEKSNVSEFSYEQIKDQFKNELLIPDKQNPDKNGLFSQEQSISTQKVEQFFKEFESVLSGKSGMAADGDFKPKDVAEIIKFSKSDSTKPGESLQMGPSDAKTDVLGSALKAKAPRRMPAYVMNQVGKSIVRAVNQGENTLRLQLKPAELGRLVMTIDNVGNSMKVSIITENPVAKDILASHVNELKTVLAAAGISLDKFDVDMSGDFRQSMADTKNQSGNSNGKNRNTDKNLFESGSMDGVEGGSLASTIQDGSYHFVA